MVLMRKFVLGRKCYNSGYCEKYYIEGQYLWQPEPTNLDKLSQCNILHGIRRFRDNETVLFWFVVSCCHRVNFKRLSATYCFHFFFYPEGGDITVLRNTEKCLQDHMVSHQLDSLNCFQALSNDAAYRPPDIEIFARKCRKLRGL
jgi:hypothetical protein